MSILEQICARKRIHIEERKIKIPLAELKKQIKTVAEPRGFIKAIKKTKGPAVIAEIKKASPAHGVIRGNFDARGIGKIFQNSGAACLSILTDEPYFQGKDSYLSDTHAITTIPILRKDFMLDEYQIYESRALGADCILLIMAALDLAQAKKLYALAEKLGMDVLVEIHDADELSKALKLEPAMIGINNRNLKTLKVDVDTSFQLLPQIPKEMVKISESGISDRPTIDSLIEAGFDGFLIGEGLMRQVDIGASLRDLTA
jgi:indole-3-glycerol phosphate synthase